MRLRIVFEEKRAVMRCVEKSVIRFNIQFSYITNNKVQKYLSLLRDSVKIINKNVIQSIPHGLVIEH